MLAAVSQPSTPVKTDPSSGLVGNVPVATSISSNNVDEVSGGGDTTRFLNASGPLLASGALTGFPHPMEHEAAFRAAMVQGALPFPAIYPGLHPAVSANNLLSKKKNFFFYTSIQLIDYFAKVILISVIVTSSL